jgi:hypothetical protein
MIRTASSPAGDTPDQLAPVEMSPIWPDIYFNGKNIIIRLFNVNAGSLSERIKLAKELNQEAEYHEWGCGLVDAPETDEYVRGGCEINGALRTCRVRDTYAAEIAKIDAGFKTSFKQYEDLKHLNYIVVCRASTQRYDPDMNAGYLSTSNVLLPKFGRYTQIIVIPNDAKVKLVNITRMVGGCGKIFEVYLQRGANLAMMTEYDAHERAVFCVDTPEFRRNDEMYSAIAKSLAKNHYVCGM